MRIQAATVESPGAPFTLHDLDLDAPRPEEILVRVTAAGVCHTDLGMRQTWDASRTPVVLGHEGAGVVEATGDAVTTVVPGDTVCLTFASCGACAGCGDGHPAYCDAAGPLNLGGTRADRTTTLSRSGERVFGSFFGQSSFATHALTRESNTVKVPSDLPATVAAPLGCSVQTGAGTVLNVLRSGPGTTLVVFGAGGVGLSAVMAAVAEGCAVIAVDPLAPRRALARELGAAAVLDPGTDDPAEAVRDLTAGAGAHHAIDTTGRPEAIAQAIAALRRRGTLALVGIGTAEFPTMAVMPKGLHLRGVIEGDVVPGEFIPRLVDLHRRGLLPVERLITEFPFEDIEAAARASAAGQVVKPVLTFG